VAYLQMFSKTTMKHYGYQLEEIKFTILDWARFLLYELPYNLARMVTWLGREAVLNRVGRNLPSERVVSEKEAVGFKTT
ncbi:MAG: hypothetical protein P8Y68_16925, partial [Anaerolineales bacterium]